MNPAHRLAVNVQWFPSLHRVEQLLMQSTRSGNVQFRLAFDDCHISS
jgi:hypothetical protein